MNSVENKVCQNSREITVILINVIYGYIVVIKKKVFGVRI